MDGKNVEPTIESYRYNTERLENKSMSKRVNKSLSA